ncbi:DUF4190 domain-containing protein [Rhodococcus spelaei]|nr:DUF4190 domain-containing protein [Rhodococcus spelaei]
MPTSQAPFLSPRSQKIPTARQFLGLPMLYFGLGLFLAPLALTLLKYLLRVDSTQGWFTVCFLALVLAGGVGYVAYQSPVIAWWHWLFIAFGANLFLGALARTTEAQALYVVFSLVNLAGFLGAVAGGIAASVQMSKQPATAPHDARMVAPIVGHTADGQPVYGAPIRSQSTNVFAILALVFGFLGGVLAIIFGHIALSQIKRTGESGRGLAIAGLVLGYFFVAFWLVLVISIASGNA